MEYRVVVIETLKREVVVNAEDVFDAEEIVQKMYDREEIILTAEDFDDYKLEIL